MAFWKNSVSLPFVDGMYRVRLASAPNYVEEHTNTLGVKVNDYVELNLTDGIHGGKAVLFESDFRRAIQNLDVELNGSSACGVTDPEAFLQKLFDDKVEFHYRLQIKATDTKTYYNHYFGIGATKVDKDPLVQDGNDDNPFCK